MLVNQMKGGSSGNNSPAASVACNVPRSTPKQSPISSSSLISVRRAATITRSPNNLDERVIDIFDEGPHPDQVG